MGCSKVEDELQKFLRSHGCEHIKVETSTIPWVDGGYEEENLQIRLIDLRDNHDRDTESERPDEPLVCGSLVK